MKTRFEQQSRSHAGLATQIINTQYISISTLTRWCWVCVSFRCEDSLGALFIFFFKFFESKSQSDPCEREEPQRIISINQISHFNSAAWCYLIKLMFDILKRPAIFNQNWWDSFDLPMDYSLAHLYFGHCPMCRGWVCTIKCRPTAVMKMSNKCDTARANPPREMNS